MSISATRSQASSHNKHSKRTLVTFASLSIFLVIFDQIYAIFSHGVSSLSMSLAFLYPLLGGLVLFGILGLIKPLIWQQGLYRLGFNVYNAGLASLTVSSLIRGIFEIAGTNSAYLAYLSLAGAVLAGLGLLLILGTLLKR